MYPEQDQSPREGSGIRRAEGRGVAGGRRQAGPRQESDLALGAVAQQFAAADSGGGGGRVRGGRPGEREC